jgi:tetratricopeptide (TPR) repeat protein
MVANSATLWAANHNTRVSMLRPILFVAFLLLPSFALAQVIDAPQEYKACLVLAKKNPEAGWEEALTWQSLGGGEAARHCAAIALIGLEKYGEAASRLETLANESVREDIVRAEMLAQAAQAWILANNIPRADSAQRGALVLSPGNPDILLDHAVLLAQVNHYAEAAEVLSKVLLAQPNRVEALTLRGTAFRFLDNIPGAEDDISQALKLDPDFPDALLERGILRRLKDDTKGARADWLRAMELAPESDAAELARKNLELLDVRIK